MIIGARWCSSEAAMASNDMCSPFNRPGTTRAQVRLIYRGCVVRVCTAFACIGFTFDGETLVVVPDSRLALPDELGTSGSLGIHPLEIGLPACVARRAIARSQAPVSAAGAGHEFCGGGERWLPIEDVLSDHYGGPGNRARLEQLVFDAELGQAIGQIADGLLVGEVALGDPTFRLRAEHPVDVAERPALDDDPESCIVDRARAQDDAFRH